MSIELPKDAEGREIPLDTTVLFDNDGNEIEVSRYQYYPKVGPGYWNFKSVRNKYYRQDEVYLAPPDSWEKLLEDLDKDEDICGYLKNCPETMFGKPCSECQKEILKDIASRIRKLRDEDE